MRRKYTFGPTYLCGCSSDLVSGRSLHKKIESESQGAYSIMMAVPVFLRGSHATQKRGKHEVFERMAKRTRIKT
jgi:hypothetical protein